MSCLSRLVGVLSGSCRGLVGASASRVCRPPTENPGREVGICNRDRVDNVPRSVTAPAPGRRRPLSGRVRGLAIDITPLRRSRDFRLLWGGELLSQIGSQFTLVALFVQVYALTGSSLAVGAHRLGPARADAVRLDRVRSADRPAGPTPPAVVRTVRLDDGVRPLAVRRVPRPSALGVGLRRRRVERRLSLGLDADPLRDDASTGPAGVAGPSGRPQPDHVADGAASSAPRSSGIVVSRFGLTWAYGVDAVSYVASLTAAFLVQSQRPIPADVDEEDVGLAAVRNGLRFLSGRRVLQSTFTVDIVAMVFGMPRVLFPVLSDKQFHRGTEAVGWLFAAAAFGGVRRAPRARDGSAGSGDRASRSSSR